MGRTKGVKNGEGVGKARPKINRMMGAKDSFLYLKKQGFIDDHNRLTEKGKDYVETKLQELGLYNLILLENYFLKGTVDYSELMEQESFFVEEEEQ